MLGSFRPNAMTRQEFMVMLNSDLRERAWSMGTIQESQRSRLPIAPRMALSGPTT